MPLAARIVEGPDRGSVLFFEPGKAVLLADGSIPRADATLSERPRAVFGPNPDGQSLRLRLLEGCEAQVNGVPVDGEAWLSLDDVVRVGEALVLVEPERKSDSDGMSSPAGLSSEQVRSAPAVVAGPETIALSEVLECMLSAEGTVRFEEALRRRVVRREAERLGILIAADEVKFRSAERRRALRLFDSEEFLAWLRSRGLSPAAWQRDVEAELLRLKTAESLFPDERIRERFALDRRRLDLIEISVCVVDQRDLAREIALQSREEGLDAFRRLVREWSADLDSRPGGGYLGWRSRPQLGISSADLLFAAGPGEFVGPLKEDSRWKVFFVEARRDAVLDRQTASEIRERLFNERVAALAARLRPTWTLFDLDEGGS